MPLGNLVCSMPPQSTMKKVSPIKKVHSDCPFTKEEICAIKAELYFVCSTNHTMNPPHPSWMQGVQDWYCQQSNDSSAYKTWLENELKNLQETEQASDQRPV